MKSFTKKSVKGKKVLVRTDYNVPLVDIVPHQVEGKRTLGLLAGQFTVPENFLDEDDQINSMFYGDDQ